MSYFPTMQLYDPNVGKLSQVDAQRGLKVFDLNRLVGRAFDGSTKDTNFWSEVVSGSGSVTQAGIATLDTGVTANSTVLYQTVAKARFIASETNECRILATFATAGVANNLRRVGCYTTDVNGVPVDGLYFELNGTTFSVNHANNGSITQVLNGSFNGLLGSSYTLNTSQHRFFIEYTGSTAYFSIDNTLLHTMSYGALPLGTIGYSFNGTLQNINSNGLAQSVQLLCYAHTICRMGIVSTNPRYRNITAAATYNLKYGPGRLHRVIMGGAGSNGSTCIIYDDTGGTTTIISTITTSGNAAGLSIPVTLEMGAEFQTGLKVVITGTVQLTFVWE